jgi:hypothetical protein
MNEANTSRKIQICIFYLALLQCSNLGIDNTVELQMLFKNHVRRTKLSGEDSPSQIYLPQYESPNVM